MSFTDFTGLGNKTTNTSLFVREQTRLGRSLTCLSVDMKDVIAAENSSGQDTLWPSRWAVDCTECIARTAFIITSAASPSNGADSSWRHLLSPWRPVIARGAGTAYPANAPNPILNKPSSYHSTIWPRADCIRLSVCLSVCLPLFFFFFFLFFVLGVRFI